MSRARGITQTFEASQVAGIDTRVWQSKGSSTDNRGVYFTLSGEVATVAGIKPLVRRWLNDKNTPGSPFVGNVTAIGVYSRDGIADLLVEYDGNIGLLQGDTVKVLVSGRNEPKNLVESTRFIQVANVMLILNGKDPNLKWDGEKITPLGISGTPNIPSVMESSEGDGKIYAHQSEGYFWGGFSIDKTDTTQRYKYKASWVSEFGQESELSPASNQMSDLGVPTDHRYFIMLNGLEGPPPQDDIIGRNIYRTVDGLTYFLLRYLPGTDGDHYLDTTPPDSPMTDQEPEPLSNLPPPLSRWAFYYRGRTYYGGSLETPTILYYSGKDGAKEAVSPANAVVVGNNIADPLSGFALSGDFALVFKEKSTYMLTQDKEGLPIITPVSTTVGAVSDKAAVGFEGKVFFISESGLYAFDGSKVLPVSVDIARVVKKVPPDTLKNSFGWVDPVARRVYFSICTGPGTHNNEVWALHVDNGGLSKVPVAVSSAAGYKGNVVVGYNSKPTNDGVNDLGAWGSGTKIYYRNPSELTLRSEEIERKFETRWLFGENPQSDKTYFRLDVFYVQTGGYQIEEPYKQVKGFDNRMYVEWLTDWDRNVIGGAYLTPSDPGSLIWDEANDDGTGALTWSQVEGGPSGLGPYRKLWDERRVRCQRINILVGGDMNPNNPTPLVNPSTDPSGANLTSKAIKFRFSSGGDSGWRIVGFLLHLEDHGVRAEGTDHE